MDAREMERTVAIPLEDALSSIAGVKRVLSSSEYGRTRVFVRFEGRGAGRYEAVREAAQGVYETLPPSAQRPEIVSSNNSRIPVWTAAVFPKASGEGEDPAPGNRALGGLLERVVKPALEGLEGAGEVEVSGAGLPEIVVALKPEEAAARSLSAARIAAVLGTTDVILPGGILREGDRDVILTVDGRYPDTASLAAALIPLDTGTAIPLGDLALVYERDREPDTLSRLDGKDTALIAVMGGTGAGLGKLSRRLAEELKKFAALPLEFRVLSDRGAEEAAAFRSVLAAVLQGALAVALMSALLGPGMKGRRNGAAPGAAAERRRAPLALICALTVPLTGLEAAALLTLFGIPLDRPFLAGLSVGIGAAVDAVILSSERLGNLSRAEDGAAALRKLRPPLIAGSLTTAAALLPLGMMQFAAGEIRALAGAVGAVTLVSMVNALTLLPPLFLWKGKASPVPRLRGGWGRRLRRKGRPLLRRISRWTLRALARSSRLAANRPGAVLIAALLLSLAGLAAGLGAGVDLDTEAAEDSVYVQVEFEGGFAAAEADRLLARWAQSLKTEGAVKNVQTSARTSSASALVSFDPGKAGPEKIRDLIRALPIPGGFVYIPESSGDERAWEITVSGDDGARCRELAEEAARLCAALPLIRETVLNFKEGGKRLELLPRRDRFEEAGLSFAAAADTVRRGVYGPVAYKRIGNEGETDVRVQGLGGRIPGKREIRNFIVPGGTGASRLDSLMAETEGREPSSIRREDRRRIASISLRTGAADPRRVREEVMAVLGKLELPPGYGIEFDREAIRAAEALSGTVIHFVLALLFCYMVIAAAAESFGMPLAVLSVVPPSLAFPALVLTLSGQPLNTAAACAFVAVSGMAVNAAVLSAGEFCPSPGRGDTGGAAAAYRAIRSRLPALLATGGTTIAGSVPLLFLREGSNRMARVLALVTALGVAASCLCSLVMIPALANFSPKIFKKFFLSFEASPIREP
jgi:multidrug efflux pump subunit AcrB